MIDGLKQKIDVFLDRFYEGSPFYFVPYSSEFFNNEEKNSPYSMKNGLDGVKLSARKHHIEGKSVLELISDFKTIYAERLVSPTSDDYKTQREQSGADSRFTLFLIKDNALRYSKTNRILEIDEDIYVICYAQFLKSDNPLHILKERKPGWSGPVTLPHTLSSALANITISRLKDREPILVLDPFCGSGTTLIDFATKEIDATLVGLDRDPMMRLIFADNLSALGDSCEGLARELTVLARSLQRNPIQTAELSKLSREFLSNDPPRERERDERQGFLKASAFVLSEILARSEGIILLEELSYSDFQAFSSIGFSLDACSTLGEFESLFERICFYISWRAMYYGSYRFHTSINSLPEVLQGEVEKTASEFEYLISVRNRDVINRIGAFRRTNGIFSDQITIDQSAFTALFKDVHFGNEKTIIENISSGGLPKISGYHVNNSLSTLSNIVDRDDLFNAFRPNAIITDPPYGFNTNEGGQSELEILFFSLVDVSCRLLDRRGVLTVVLPARSKNGKSISYFETKDLFVKQIQNKTKEYGRDIINISESIPETLVFPKPPYRWNSERGVSRHMLSFMLE